MSKSGNNFYYLQDELGSPMYMTGTDGMAVSSYAFDDYGRNIDPFTGNRRDKNQKHAYTTNGNIIQPFAFTGYQEDEVSGLKFAQARYYSADNGRFMSEDKVKGFKDSPFTINHYGYCWSNPVNLVDNDGNEPSFITRVAAELSIGAVKAWDAANNLQNSINSVQASLNNKIASTSVGKWVNDNKEVAGAIVSVIGVGAGVGLSFINPALGGAVGGALVDLGTQITQNGTNVDWVEVGVSAGGGALSGMLGDATYIKNAGKAAKVINPLLRIGTTTGMDTATSSVIDFWKTNY